MKYNLTSLHRHRKKTGTCEIKREVNIITKYKDRINTLLLATQLNWIHRYCVIRLIVILTTCLASSA